MMLLSVMKDKNKKVTSNAYYGEFGGQFVPEILYKPLTELEAAFTSAMKYPKFKKELNKAFSLHFVN